MNLTKTEVYKKFNQWLTAWNMHDLDGVMEFMHQDVSFENPDGRIVSGKEMLRRSWMPWFMRHEDFKFFQEDIFFDEQSQKMTFQWRMEWFPVDYKLKGQNKTIRGVDILEFKEGKIFRKISYSKTAIEIGVTTAADMQVK